MDLPPLYAHRLGRAYGPDSSRPALEAALASGAEGLETDVCLTADGRLVLLHDPLLALRTTLDGWAHQRAAAEIVAARLRDREHEPTAEHPLLLDELLDAVPDGLGLQLEVKAHADPELAERTARAVCELCRGHPHRERIEVTSFHGAACAAAAAAGYRSRLVIHAEYAPEALAAWAVHHGVAGISVEHFLLTPRLLSALRLAGLSLMTGTVNHAELLRRVVEIAAPDAVCTDRPAELRAEATAAGIAGTAEPALAAG